MRNSKADKRLKKVVKALVTVGYSRTVNSQSITVYAENGAGLITSCAGTTDPVANLGSQSVFAKGCEYIKTDASTGTSGKYQNVGTAASSTFALIEGTEAVLTGVTADTGLLGGGSSGTPVISRGLSVRNETGGTLAKGTLVRVSGYANSMPLVVAADANVAAGAAMYVLTADISNNANGSAYGVVVVTNINTDAASAVGDPLYLSETAGAFTPTAPTASSSKVQRVGIVLVKHATTGSALFFPELRIMDKVGRDEIQDGSITPAKGASSGSLTATADGTGTGAANADSTHFEVTSANATDQVSLPSINNSNKGKPITFYVGANGCELITPAASNATINGTDADGTNQADIPANSMVRLTPVSNTAWIMEIIGSTGTVAAAVVPDND